MKRQIDRFLFKLSEMFSRYSVHEEKSFLLSSIMSQPPGRIQTVYIVTPGCRMIAYK